MLEGIKAFIIHDIISAMQKWLSDRQVGFRFLAPRCRGVAFETSFRGSAWIGILSCHTGSSTSPSEVTRLGWKKPVALKGEESEVRRRDDEIFLRIICLSVVTMHLSSFEKKIYNEYAAHWRAIVNPINEYHHDSR